MGLGKHMYNQVHSNAVLYRPQVQVGSRYRQIVIVEKENFEVRVFDGDVVQLEPQFLADSTDAVITFHPTLNEAIQDAEKEFRDSASEGWEPYDPLAA
jgi:hypothetical protein